MRHENTQDPPAEEPRFDLPPRFHGIEQRMARRAANAWAARGGGQNLLPLASVDLTYGAEFAANSMLIDLRGGDAPRLLTVGEAVVATFGLSNGALLDDAPHGLGMRLAAGCNVLRQTLTEVPFEAALRSPHIACLLTRGVLMPLADDQGALGYAHCVLSWKQFIDAKTSAILREELRQALPPTSSAGRKYRKN